MTFAEFMEQALYGANGYYTNTVVIGGAGADFFTAAHSPLFGVTVAHYIYDTWLSWGKPRELAVVELGAGEGRLASHIMEAVLPLIDGQVQFAYRIVERSPVLRQRQLEHLHDLVAQLQPAVSLSWASNLDDQASVPLHRPTVLIANEVLDALPVERLRRQSKAWQRACVVAGGGDSPDLGKPGDGPLTWSWEPASQQLSALANHWLPIPVESSAEICAALPAFIAACAGVTTGPLRALYFDYGITVDEWAAGARPEGTLRAYRQHQIVSDVLDACGGQDITADVHWDYTTACAREAGFSRIERVQQGRFLVEHGILNVLAARQSLGNAVDAYRLAGEFKQLCLPGGMGERFEVLLCQRDGVGGHRLLDRKNPFEAEGESVEGAGNGA